MQKIKQFLQGGGVQALAIPETFLRSFNDLYSRQALSSAALAVGATTTKFKIGAAVYVVIGGVLQLVASADGPVLAAGYNLTSTQFGGYVVTVDQQGVQYALQINPAASIGSVVWPEVPASQVAIGAVLINTTNAAAFTSGVTLLSATNVSYLNFTGPFNPTNAF